MGPLNLVNPLPVPPFTLVRIPTLLVTPEAEVRITPAVVKWLRVTPLPVIVTTPLVAFDED